MDRGTEFYQFVASKRASQQELPDPARFTSPPTSSWPPDGLPSLTIVLALHTILAEE